jgi:hypothetical protein
LVLSTEGDLAVRPRREPRIGDEVVGVGHVQASMSKQLAFSFGLDGHFASNDGVHAIGWLDVLVTGIYVFIVVVLVALFPYVVRLVGRIRSLLTHVDRLENAAIPFQCFGIVFFVVTTSTTFFDGVDLTVIFPSMLAPVIVTAVTPLITLVAVVARVVVLVAAVKIVVPTTVATVVIVVWGVVGARNPCCFFDNYLFSVIGVRIFLSGGQERCDRFRSLAEELVPWGVMEAEASDESLNCLAVRD